MNYNAKYRTHEVPDTNLTYVNAIMRTKSWPCIWDLFTRAGSPLKELSESWSAVQYLPNQDDHVHVHIGDGAHARTAALGAFFRKGTHVAIDPAANMEVIDAWQEKYNVQRFHAIKARWQDEQAAPWLAKAQSVTFVHAHVTVDDVLDACPVWSMAYTLLCCHPRTQTSHKFRPSKSGHDWAVLSDKRKFALYLRNELHNNPKLLTADQLLDAASELIGQAQQFNPSTDNDHQRWLNDLMAMRESETHYKKAPE